VLILNKLQINNNNNRKIELKTLKIKKREEKKYYQVFDKERFLKFSNA